MTLTAQPKPERIEHGQVWLYHDRVRMTFGVVGNVDGDVVQFVGTQAALVGDMRAWPQWHYIGMLDPMLMEVKR